MPYRVKILGVSSVAKNVKRFACQKPRFLKLRVVFEHYQNSTRPSNHSLQTSGILKVEKPSDYRFIPGQATLVAIDKKGWRHKQRPFTFTSLNSSNHLEFIIKTYKGNKGVTNELDRAKAGDFLLIREPFGSINYAGEGVFIAGGAGITPFIAILKQLKKDMNLGSNKLIFFNKTEADIILKKELKEIFKSKRKNLILALTEQEKKGYFCKRASKLFFKENISDFSQKFYICGPELFIIDVIKFLKQLGAKKSSIVVERDF